MRKSFSEPDLHDGQTWVGVTPFSVTRIRPSILPTLPILSEPHEGNVRVYVERDGVPGIWFPSLEITNRLAHWAARLSDRLPYFHARMRVERRGDRHSFRSRRPDNPGASLEVESPSV